MIKLSDAKAINVFRDGIWQNQKMGYVYYNGEWVPLLEYRKWIYEEGIEHIPLIDAVGGNSFAVDKQEDKIRLYNGRGIGEASIETGISINLSDKKTLFIDWEETENYHTQSKAYIGEDEILSVSGMFERKIDKIDVSDFLGEFSIRLKTQAVSINRKTSLYIYNIWLE